MEIENILNFLSGVAANNNREWFLEHKEEFERCQTEFREGIDLLIAKLSVIDPEIEYLKAADCCYRFYRDIRFSLDKSPYKRHFGAYICRDGKKSLRGGYYVHVQPGHCLVAFGCYYLPTKMLNACREEMLDREEEWRQAVENKAFLRLFGRPTSTDLDLDQENLGAKGFGLSALKKLPRGFNGHEDMADYLRLKSYACWRRIDDAFFCGDKWVDSVAKWAKAAKPAMDFINAVLDDFD